MSAVNGHANDVFGSVEYLRDFIAFWFCLDDIVDWLRPQNASGFEMPRAVFDGQFYFAVFQVKCDLAIAKHFPKLKRDDSIFEILFFPGRKFGI